MAKEKFVRRHLSEEERARLLHKDKELTEAETEKVKRYKEMIEVMERRAREEALARGGKIFNDDVYEKIDTSPEPRDEESTNTRDDGR